MQGVTEPTPPTLGATEATGCPLGGAGGGAVYNREPGFGE